MLRLFYFILRYIFITLLRFMMAQKQIYIIYVQIVFIKQIYCKKYGLPFI